MDANEAKKRNRREFLVIAGAATTGVMLAGSPLGVRGAAGATGSAMKIGIIGAGRIGGTLGGLWVKSGHEVMLSARNLDPVQKLVADLGPMAHAGTPYESTTAPRG